MSGQNGYNPKLEEILQHHGIKGMRWGIRKKTDSSSRVNKEKKVGRIKQELNSLKRERSWEKGMKPSKMTDSQLQSVNKRLMMENRLKKLNRKEYLTREKLSNVEIEKRVNRLQLEKNLKQQYGLATKEQKAIGKQIASFASTVTIASITGVGAGVAVGTAVGKAVTKELAKTADKAVKKKVGVSLGFANMIPKDET
jgi:hypothetical protein